MNKKTLLVIASAFAFLLASCDEGTSNNDEKSVCGDGAITGAEVCDGTDLGENTCNTFFKDEEGQYRGKPICSTDCLSIEVGTCEADLCRNEKLDEGEICDVINDVVVFAGEPATCKDFDDKVEWASGTPGCAKDCKGLAKGTCAEAGDTTSGILSCEFSTMVEGEDSTLTATAKIQTTEGVSASDIEGQLSCGKKAVKMMTWSLNEKATKTDCADCADNDYTYAVDYDFSKLAAGNYDCVFQFSTGVKGNAYYACPLVNGEPTRVAMEPEETAYATDLQIRSFEIEGEAVEGEIIAQWTMAELENGDMHKTVKADEGALKDSAELRLSAEDAEMEIVTGPGGMGTGAALGKNWSVASTLDLEADAHFIIEFETTGYSNIKVKYSIAGSGNGEKYAQTAIMDGSNVVTLGEVITITGKNQYEHPVYELSSSDNKDKVEVRVYPYGVAGPDATARIADILITGEK